MPGSGGGVYNSGKLTASYLTIQDNGTGAGFSESEPGGAGGGIANVIRAGIKNSFELRDSLVQGNRTSPGGAGGGIAMTGTITDTTVMLVSSSQVISNTARASGGGLALVDASARLESLIVASNHITDTASGAGLYIQRPETIVDPPGLLHSQARHLTIAGNQGGDGSGLYDLWANIALTDTILAGQSVGVVVTGTTTLTMTNTLWGRKAWANGVDWLGAGTLVTDTLNLFDDLGILDPLNLFDDPCFLDPPNLDFHLQPGSPAIDRGIDKFPLLDVDAQPRPDPTSQLPDIGADELWALVPLSGAEIIPPTVITATVPASFDLVLAPPDVAPAPRCFWLPAPETNQWTCSPTLVFPNPGEQSVEVWLLQGGSPPLHLQTTLAIQPLWRNLYLPLLKR